MSDTIFFQDHLATSQSLVGGKGVNLAILAQAGFLVPNGFTIVTTAYSNFLNMSGLRKKIASALEQLDVANTEELEKIAVEIRRWIVATSDENTVGALDVEIIQAYQQLGDRPYVAVRSSGSAEDLADSSFAGLHDTYLDIRGQDEVLDAVRRCWASLWTARAIAYRQERGYDHLEVTIAVVVQTMVESESSGVLFTGNPMNAANDELVINASWGLGEAIVGGITTPDDFVVKAKELRIIEKKLGSKLVQIIRNPDSNKGVIELPVPAALSEKFSLTDAQAIELAAIGQKIEAHYQGYPQDIEWALVSEQFYILQARPITNVEFSWDCDINASVNGSEADFIGEPRLEKNDDNYLIQGEAIKDDQLWGRALSDEGWAGACTPLMFSWRGLTMNWGHQLVCDKAGYPHLGNREARLWYYLKGKAYFNVDQDRAFIEETTPPMFRPYTIARMPKDWQQQVQDAPFDWSKWFDMYVRFHTRWLDDGLPWIGQTNKFIARQKSKHDGLSAKELQKLTDDEVKAYSKQVFELEVEYGDAVWSGLILFFRDAACLLDYLVASLYTGENESVRSDIMAGSPRRCITARENHWLYEFAVKIRHSKVLNQQFNSTETANVFFNQLSESDDGRAFLVEYNEFLQEHGHRGHSDRDVYFLRRAENFEVDFRPLKAILSSDTLVDPNAMEETVNQRREAARADIIANLHSQPFGTIKAEIFKLLHEYVHECIMARDEERHFLDRGTFSIKRGYTEIGRRLLERGVLKNERDYFFLTQPELFALFDGEEITPLIQTKIDARALDFDRVNDKLVTVPLFVRRGVAANIDTVDYGDGVLAGTATSRGVVTGKARVIKSLAEIPRVREGDILVVNATDPGWTPVFILIKGIVLETGGMLAHGSLLAREYGFPAVQVENAMSYISDGATITVDGDNSLVKVHPELNESVSE